MKASKTRSLWIAIISLIYTADTCIRASFMHLTKRINRDWVNRRLQIWQKQMFKTLNIQCTVINPHNTEPKPGEATIILCNHSSLYDIPITYHAFPNISLRMLGKKELTKIPFFGMAMKGAEFPCIDRKNKKQAIEDLNEVRRLLKSGIVMWIAPEGTRSKDGRLASFKKGPFITAIQAQATIIPIGIRGAYDILPARTHQFSLNQKAEVHIGEPIDASSYTIEDKEKLMEITHEAMKKLVGESN